MERRRVRPPIHVCTHTYSSGTHNHIDYVVVDEDWPQLELIAEVERLEQPVIDDDVAHNTLDSARCDLRSDGLVATKWIGRGQDRVAKCVRLVVVEVANRVSAIRVGAPAHRQIPACDQHKIAVEHTAVVDPPLRVDRGTEHVSWTKCF